jgi:predicted ATPase
MKRNERGEYYSVNVSIRGQQAKRQSNRPPKNITRPIKCYGFSAEAMRSYGDSEYLNELVYSFEQVFSNVYHLAPVRDYPQRQYTWFGDKPSDVGRKGERAIAALLASGDEPIQGITGHARRKSANKLMNRVSYWLQQMGLSASLVIKPVVEGGALYEVQLERSGGGEIVLLPDMGFGVSQILPVIVLCYYCPQGSTLLLEQPEIHLHPSAQAVLADMFIEVIQERYVQIILESHSEHLLTRLQLRIAEGKVNSENETALYFCDFKDGVSHLQSLEIDLFGEIQNYPHEFFGDLAGDVINRAIVGAERRMQGQV